MITEKKWLELREELEKFSIKESDIEETFILSSKKGGQKVNKTSSCVQLKHKSYNITVKCQISRSQDENRYFARKLLLEKIQQEIFHIETKKILKLKKLKKQKKNRQKKSEIKYHSPPSEKKN